jgi:hypothetical protein
MAVRSYAGNVRANNHRIAVADWATGTVRTLIGG